MKGYESNSKASFSIAVFFASATLVELELFWKKKRLIKQHFIVHLG